MNNGKKFEKFIEESTLLQDIDITRLKDAGFQGSAQAGKRFTSKNLCDFILFDGSVMCYLEAKSTGTSLSFGDSIEVQLAKRKAKKSNTIKYGGIRQKLDLFNKSERLKKQQKRNNVMVGLLIEFKRKNITSSYWWLDIDDILTMEKNIDKKSFNEKDCADLGFNSRQLETWKPVRAKKARLDIENMIMVRV